MKTWDLISALTYISIRNNFNKRRTTSTLHDKKINRLSNSNLDYYQEATFFGAETCLSNSSKRCTVSGFPRNSEKDFSYLILCITAKTSSVVTPCFMSYSICLAQLDIVLYFLKLRFSKDDASGEMPLI
jgi:hypothetical protein